MATASAGAVYVGVELAQTNTLQPNTLQDYSIVNKVINIAYTLHFFSSNGGNAMPWQLLSNVSIIDNLK